MKSETSKYIVSFEKKVPWKDILQKGFRLSENLVKRYGTQVLIPINRNEHVSIIRKSDGKRWYFELS